MSSIFSKIIAGEIPCYKVAEDEKHLAFLDIRPQTKGHTLCIPKEEVDYIFDLSDSALQSLMCFSKKVAKAMESVISCERIGVAVVGLEVPHAHVHLFPLKSMGDFGFGKDPVKMSSEEMSLLAESIRANIQ